MRYVIYQARNVQNSRRYIGVTGHKRYQERKSEHRLCASKAKPSALFHRAIKKYGFDAFEWTILDTVGGKEEAFKLETKLISILRPEYNVTPGGDGRTSGRRLARSVRCLTDGKRYVSARSASRKYKISAPLIGWSCRTGKKAKGHRFEYAQAARHNGQGSGHPGRPIICVTDGRTFPSAAVAAREYGVHPTSINGICRRKPRCESVKGLIFRFVGDPIDDIDLTMIRSKRYMRPVVCCADGKRYDSIGEAAAAYGVGLSAVSAVLRGKAETTAGGLIFRYANDPTASEIIPAKAGRSHTRAVICETDGKRHESLSAAGKAYDIDFRVIWKAVRGIVPDAGGRTFRYA